MVKKRKIETKVIFFLIFSEIHSDERDLKGIQGKTECGWEGKSECPSQDASPSSSPTDPSNYTESLELFSDINIKPIGKVQLK